MSLLHARPTWNMTGDRFIDLSVTPLLALVIAETLEERGYAKEEAEIRRAVADGERIDALEK